MSRLFIQPGNNIAAYPDDPRFSAMGNFQVATAGMQSSSTVGELWVSYHVRLIKPQLENDATSSTTRLHGGWVSPSGGAAASYGFLKTTNPGALNLEQKVTTQQDFVLTCSSIAGIGTYIIASCTRQATAATTLLSQAVPYARANGTATVITLSYNSTTGAPDTQLCTFPNASATSTGSTGQLSPNSAAEVYLVNLANVGDTVYFPTTYCSSSIVYHDIYVAAYVTQFTPSGLSMTDTKDDISTMRKQLETLMAQQSQFALTLSEIAEEEEEYSRCDTDVTSKGEDVKSTRRRI